jgi:hypothetical protein
MDEKAPQRNEPQRSEPSMIHAKHEQKARDNSQTNIDLLVIQRILRHHIPSVSF